MKEQRIVPRSLGGLVGTDLKGWRLCMCYLLQLSHGLMGFFPALYKTGALNNTVQELFVCTDKEVLREIWKQLPCRASEVVSTMMLVHENGFAFSLHGLNSRYELGKLDSRDKLRVIDRETLHRLTEYEGGDTVFTWANGLLSLVGAPDKAAFHLMIDRAISELT